MLTEEDIQFIKETRKEIEQNRTDTLIIYHENESVEINPITGDPIPAEPTEEVIEATFSRLASQSAGGNGNGVVMVGGVVAETGNAIINFDVEVDVSDVDKVKHVASDIMWSIKSRDKIGLGEVNRNYVLLERVT